MVVMMWPSEESCDSHSVWSGRGTVVILVWPSEGAVVVMIVVIMVW